jgi:hypothetical protein
MVRIVQQRLRTGGRTKEAISTRLDANKKVHRQQMDLPKGVLVYLKGTGKAGEQFEVRTEALIHGTRYRAHPNYRGHGPAYDFVKVEFDILEERPLDPLQFPDDELKYPAKLVAFFRQVPTPDIEPSLPVLAAEDYFVLAHCADFQMFTSDVYDRKTLLTRSWLYEVTASNKPLYTRVGTVKDPNLVGHVFGLEEKPGFHEEYETEEKRRFIVLSDMRKEWPKVFVGVNGE